MTNPTSEITTVFADGSNMLTARIMARVPSVCLLESAVLERFLLRWNKRSKDGSAKCSIEETGHREDVVWGVLYGLHGEEKGKLNGLEGLGRGYGERVVTVLAQGKPLRVSAYYATSIDLNIRPYDWYRDLIVAGAREHGLPPDYINSLEAVPAIEDPDRTRAVREIQVLRAHSA
ncbi:MAG: gamma-glutamylcyclotransferase family protein [Steroidobacteraceae bacterium]